MLRFLLGIVVAVGGAAALVAMTGAWILLTTPRPNDINSCIVAKMYEVRLCPSDATYAPLSSISKYFRDAVVSSEDGAFYEHHGFDWHEMRESFDKNWALGEFARGGSTLTQQLAKNVYLTKEKSILRKLREALIVVQLEKNLSKDEILEKYLNVVEFGPDIFGVGAAADFYFQKKPAQLDPTESAFLAFLLPNPKKYSSSFRAHKLTRFARKQIKVILDRMWRSRKLDDGEHEQSIAELDRIFGAAPDLKNEGQPSADDADGADPLPSVDRPPESLPSAKRARETLPSAEGPSETLPKADDVDEAEPSRPAATTTPAPPTPPDAEDAPPDDD